MTFTVYFGLAVVGALWLTNNGRIPHPLTTFLLTFWILGGSIIHEDKFNLPIPGLGSEVQIGQLICYALIISLMHSYAMEGNRTVLTVRFPFEKYLLLLFLWYLLVLLYHFYEGGLRWRDVRGLSEASLTVACIYLWLKRCASWSDIRVLARALIIVAAVSSLVAVIQFTVNPYLLRVGSMAEAFGGHLRSNGVFWSEYLHSYMVITGLLVTLLFVRSRRLRLFLIPLSMIGILMSFHRMSWIVAAIVVALYMVVIEKRSLSKMAFGAAVTVFFLYALTSDILPVMESVEGSSFYQSRLKSDTMTDRLRFYGMVLDRFDQGAIMGIGSVKSEIYYSGMMNLGMGEEWATGVRGGIHNYFLEIMLLYGAPILVVMTLFLISALRTFKKLMTASYPFYLLPFSFVTAFIIMNFTNSLPINGELGVVMALVLGSSTVYSAMMAEGIRNGKGPGG